jgi:predicted nucleic acid-binding protein
VAFVALLDACVLYPVELRNLLLCVAEQGLYRPAWSQTVLSEMRKNILQNNPHLVDEQLDHLVDQMKQAFPEAMVEGYQALESSMTNDVEDRHVLAAAIRGRADVVVTFNLKHFRPEHCEPYDLDVQTPDDFLLHAFHLRPNRFWAAVETQVSRNRNTPNTVADLLNSLRLALPELTRTLAQ